MKTNKQVSDHTKIPGISAKAAKSEGFEFGSLKLMTSNFAQNGLKT